ncbi:flagellar hook-basal body protein [Alkalicoccus chagannorensis]|uniref:flagellar hook-basal body protein n=1 Tax=Alkalicoccus chagannorensis TaxID=427072 RepID=UPI0004233A35|nr:flagellar hook-basal body protein [Alkalicoccus chagannorensis]
MLRGLYSAGAGMMAQQRQQEMHTNNLSNAETPGYKADQGSLRKFPNMIAAAMGTQAAPNGAPRIGELTTGVYMQERTPNFRQGDVQETGNNTDVALFQSDVPVDEETGEEAMLAFNVAAEDGEIRYTRNGNFTIDQDGFLTTAQGNYILDTEGEPVELDNDQIRISPEGEVFDEDETLITQLDVSVIPDPTNLVKEGEGLLNYEGEAAIASAVGDEDISYQLQQGFVERSNVDAQQTTAQMMNAMNTFEMNQTVLQAYDQNLERTVNDIGRIQ